jgi:hypothetical protein
MATITGILSVSDLFKQTFNTCVEYDLNRIFDVLNDDLKNYNSQVSETMSMFCQHTDKQSLVFNTNSGYAFHETDEFGGKPVTRKDNGNWTVAFGVRKFETGLGWSREFLAMRTPSELAADYQKIQLADQKNMIGLVKKAIFNNANVNFVDAHYNGVTLGLKRFWNADSSNMPTNSLGVSFSGSAHTHYTARSGSVISNADVDALISNVTEHDQTMGVKLFMNGADVAAMAANCSKFKGLASSLITYGYSDITTARLDLSDLSNYMVGIWDGRVEVWVKAYVPANYILCMATEMTDKPLGFRELPFPTMQGLNLSAISNTGEPLVAQTATRYAGINVLNRSAGAVLYTGGTVWANPTL